MKASKVWLLGAAVILAGCAAQQTGPYRDVSSLLNAPPPQTYEELTQQCIYLRQEIAQQRTIASTDAIVLPGTTILSIQEKASRNIAALTTRYINIGCNKSFSSQDKPATKEGDGDYIDLCMAKCKQYTNRTPEQCFDSCK
jgi:hypothetical protein